VVSRGTGDPCGSSSEGAILVVLLLLVVRAVRGGGTTVGDAGYEDRIRSAEAEIKAASKELKK